MFMAIALTPELGVPYSDDVPYVDLRERAEAACNTAQLLAEHGLDVEPTPEDEQLAAKLAVSYASDPDKTSKTVTNKRAAKLPPASLVAVHNILSEFSHSIVESAVQVRHLVTNKLIEETENPDPRVRIRALELLGKISDVGLFSEKSEVTITHQTTDELREKLRSKLAKLVNPTEDDENVVIIDVETVESTPTRVNLDDELGSETESDG
jgi:hypothetical protein